MRLRPVHFHSAARRELRREVEYYDERGQDLGDELTAEVERVIQEIYTYPELGTPYQADTRRVQTQRFPLSIVYRLQPERILIVAIAHHRRTPGYWHQRG